MPWAISLNRPDFVVVSFSSSEIDFMSNFIDPLPWSSHFSRIFGCCWKCAEYSNMSKNVPFSPSSTFRWLPDQTFAELPQSHQFSAIRNKIQLVADDLQTWSFSCLDTMDTQCSISHNLAVSYDPSENPKLQKKQQKFVEKIMYYKTSRKGGSSGMWKVQTVKMSVSLTLRRRDFNVFLISSKSPGWSSSCSSRLIAITVFGFLKKVRFLYKFFSA